MVFTHLHSLRVLFSHISNLILLIQNPISQISILIRCIPHVPALIPCISISIPRILNLIHRIPTPISPFSLLLSPILLFQRSQIAAENFNQVENTFNHVKKHPSKYFVKNIVLWNSCFTNDQTDWVF